MPPVIRTDPMNRLLRAGNISEFNLRKGAGELADLKNADFRGLDLRGLDASGLDFSGAYFRQADLRAIDFTHSRLEGASLNHAQVSGCYFPRELEASEITMSLVHGTRMRYRTH